MKIVEFLLENYIGLISVFISLVSLIIASKTLKHSKRTTIVIEKYEPILKEVAAAKTIEIYENKSFELRELKAVKESYVYYAFSKKLKKSIERVFLNAEIYEVQRKKLDEKLNATLTEVLKPECSKYLSELNDKYEYKFSELFFCNKDKEREVRIFELFMSDKLSREIEIGTIKGYFNAERYVRGRQYIEEAEEWIEDLFNEGWIQVYLNGLNIYEQIDEDDMNYYWESEKLDYVRYIDEHSSEIKQEIYFWEDYIKYHDAYKIVSKELLEIDNLIQNYIKELLIPQYRVKRLFGLLK